MGLSNEERYIGMLVNIEQVTETASYLNSRDYKNLKKHAENLWPMFRAAYSNDSGYCENSDCSLEDDRMGSFENPTYVAFEKIKSSYTDDTSQELFSYSDRSSLIRCLEIDYVINDVNLAGIIRISNCVKYFRSYINRYDDQFAKKYKDVDSIISLIEREIYLIFRDNHEVYDAWIVKNMLNKVINVFDDDDILIQFILSEMHNFRVSEQTDGKTLSKFYFDKVQHKNSKDFTLTERLEVILTILGRRFYYPSAHDKLRKLIKEQDVDMKLVESLLNTCIEKRKDYDEINSFNLSKMPCYLRTYY